MSRFWIKFEGCDSDSFSKGNSTYTAIQLPIFGIFPSFEVESGSEVSISGREIGQRKIRRSLEVNLFPNTTWQDGVAGLPTTDSALFLLDTVLQRKFTRINKPDAPMVLPDRWNDSTDFPLSAGLIPFVFARCDISNEKNWGAGMETLTITCYARDLN